MQDTKKRLFFACEVLAPWQEPGQEPGQDHPSHGRLIDPSHRHLTLAFLGNVLYSSLEKILSEFPHPNFKISPVGYFDQCLFLPPRHPRVVAWNVKWFKEGYLESYQEKVTSWLQSRGYLLDKRSFLSHVTIARAPFSHEQWKNSFIPLPMVARAIHLYESIGNLVYKPIWSLPLFPAFEEISHTADLAFQIQGQTMEELHLHAMFALAFKHPQLLGYILNTSLQKKLDDIIMELNKLISISDEDIGSPFKAVSFHGDVFKENGILKWEMIVDV